MHSPHLIRLLTVLLQQQPKDAPTFPPRAEGVATFTGKVHGQVFLTPTPNGQIHIQGTLFGLRRNMKMGVHIHETGDLGNSCNNAAGHWSLFDHDHGALTSNVRHDGDLGNLMTDSNGKMLFNLFVTQNPVDPTDGFIGLSLVIHEKPDDLGKGRNAASLVNGNSGRRVACGVIGYRKRPTFGICALP